ncbi:hypothetical protein CCO03_17875 [Comamonas serinivorans]|uniref:Type II secretion system protein GspC N-terminal domain-containing protein n=1 Tax=Comamonas serinivorans TaxID=1082851 RepID=A0A1Y0ERL8_9BURK|nr:hypothetical protein [Comamonas serinivorans]ARU06297.1 hypothetical protein CCO03_17875 [Comamonas serinivorans]
MTGRFVPALVGVNAVLAVALAAVWLGPQGVLRHTIWQAPAPQGVNLDDAANGVLAANPAVTRAYPEVLDRPLFAAARRPVAAPEPEDDKPAAPPPIALDKVVLTGIVAGPRLTGALAQVDGESRFLKVGDQVGDWQVDGVTGRDVRFHKGDEKRTLTLPYAHASAPDAGDAGKASPKPVAPRADAVRPPPQAAPQPPRRPPSPPVLGTGQPNGRPEAKPGAIQIPFGGSVPSRRRPASATR